MKGSWTAARAALSGLVAIAASVGGLGLAPSASALTFRSGQGLQVVSQRALDARLHTLQVRTTALPGPANIRILLPSGYARHPHRHYPVLYLLHGTSGGASDWTVLGHAEQLTAGRPLIVVMPDIALNDDGGGWCTNWPDGRYHWLTFHIDQLLPWVQANLRTLNSRSERAIAGLSQGGFCSMSYAARYPQLFGISLAYSGAPDIAYSPETRPGAMAIINATEVGLDHVAPDSMFGNPITDYLNWADHDPSTLAGNLRHTKLYMYFGNGQLGPYDGVVPNPGAQGIEAAVYEDNIYFHQHLEQLHIAPAVYDYYGNGTHSWPYWTRDLKWSLPDVMTDFAHPSRAPRTFSYQAAAPGYSLYGWSVTLHRRALEFSTLNVTATTAFTLSGSGGARVITPRRFKRRSSYRIMLWSASGRRTLIRRPNHAGQLVISVPLGPSDVVQEYSDGGPPATSPGTHVYTTRVTIRRVRRR
jgi:S-formylglutathione hydrolase FrmB